MGGLFRAGMEAAEASQRPGVPGGERDKLLDEAIAAFRAMLVRRPELVRVRLELARAFFLKGEDKLARRHFEHVLAGKPPAAVALNVSRFLKIMRARKRWSLRLGMARSLPDTNIGAGSDERIDLHPGPTPFGRLRIYPGGATPRPNRVSASRPGWAGNTSTRWATPERGPGQASWRLRAGGDLSRREYRESAFDTDDASPAMSGRAG